MMLPGERMGRGMVLRLETSGLIEDLGYRLWSSSCFLDPLSPGKGRMHVTLNETDRLDFVLKKFRRQVTKAGLFQDMKKKRFYESPAVQRRRKSKAAARRKAKGASRREQY